MDLVTVTLPRVKTFVGGTLNEVATNLNLCANVAKTASNGDVVYKSDSQVYFEDVLTHSNVMLIVAEGGEIENYIMYGECPDTIYSQNVPDTLEKNKIKILSSGVITEVVKTFGQWADSSLSQTFKSDKTKLYVLTNPIMNKYLKGSELKIMVDSFGVSLLTCKEYKVLEDSGQIITG